MRAVAQTDDKAAFAMAEANEIQVALEEKGVSQALAAGFVLEGYDTKEAVQMCFRSEAALDKFLGRWVPAQVNECDADNLKTHPVTGKMRAGLLQLMAK